MRIRDPGMLRWLNRFLLRMTKVPVVLTVMRLDDMLRVHPHQITAKCARCGHDVGVYPSGQKIMAEYGDRVELVCQVCHFPGPKAELAPGAESEPLQSRWKERR